MMYSDEQFDGRDSRDNITFSHAMAWLHIRDYIMYRTMVRFARIQGAAINDTWLFLSFNYENFSQISLALRPANLS